MIRGNCSVDKKISHIYMQFTYKLMLRSIEGKKVNQL